jgi:uncharacterized membrane protein YoaK (UPF0700 family)
VLPILKWLAGHRKPLRRRKRPWLAATLGLLLGALGAGVYLGSFVDFVICFVYTAITGVAAQTSGSPLALVPYLTGSAIYAFHRARISNDKRAAQT